MVLWYSVMFCNFCQRYHCNWWNALFKKRVTTSAPGRPTFFRSLLWEVVVCSLEFQLEVWRNFWKFFKRCKVRRRNQLWSGSCPINARSIETERNSCLHLCEQNAQKKKTLRAGRRSVTRCDTTTGWATTAVYPGLSGRRREEPQLGWSGKKIQPPE